MWRLQYKRLVQGNKLSNSVKDEFSVIVGNSLIIPKRHFPDSFELTQQPELNAAIKLFSWLKHPLF